MNRIMLGLVWLVSAGVAPAADPLRVPLWDGGAPGFEARKDEQETRDRQNRDTGEYRVTGVHNPYLTVFLPDADKATGTAVVIVPGGGHRELWVMHEGENLARWLADRGVAAGVLRHRLAREPESPYKIDVHALQDGQRALRVMRHRATEWKLNPEHVGLMGFSAGGEVVAMVCNAAAAGDTAAPDPVDQQSAVPAFQAHVYSGPLGIRDHAVTKETAPPAFLLVGDDDPARKWLVPHYLALKEAGVSAELHVISQAPHGFGFRPNQAKGSRLQAWPEQFLGFLQAQKLLPKS